tara:strand:- start:12844 stop:15042 length:2199 start_codon:yes stop_codon:yes gene_type:complete
MLDYTDIKVVNDQVKQSQDAESDQRDMVRKERDFLYVKDGQWDQGIVKKMGDKYRGTFDKCNVVVNGIVGEMDAANFDIKIRPSGGDATKELAKTYDGLIRNIETMSNAARVYASAGRDMVGTGLGGWEVKMKYIDADLFDQDFVIEWIPDYVSRVWFDAASIQQDASDARHVFSLDNYSVDEYEKEFPEGSKQSIGSDKAYDSFTNKPESITVGRIIYRSPVNVTLVQMDDGSVYVRDEKFDSIADELAEQGINVKRERVKKTYKIVSRLFDGGAFLNDPEDTVFKDLPIVPTYANFNVAEGKVIYKGAVRDLMDTQRAYNTFRSAEVENIAMSPPDVYWVSRVQAKIPADKAAIENMSASSARANFFTPDPANPGAPQRSGGAVVQSGVQQAIQNSLDDISTTASRSPLANGEGGGGMSGVAIQSLQNKMDTGTVHYFRPQEVAICRTGVILVNALPNGYDSTAQKRILGEGGEFEMVELNKSVVDTDTGKTVKLNDLTQGKYDVTCSAGKAFKNRQQESVEAFEKLSMAIPGFGELTADIQLKNIEAPGADLAAERIRAMMVRNGTIPESQLTDEERDQMAQAQQAAAQQPPEQTPEQKIADAEIGRVQAETADVQVKAQLKQEELRIKEQDSLLKNQTAADRTQLLELTLMLKQQAQQSSDQQAMNKAMMDGQASIIDNLNTQAQTLKILGESMGADAVISQGGVEAYAQQTEIVADQQDDIIDTVDQ